MTAGNLRIALCDHRNNRKVGVRQMARDIGISYQSFSRFERGEEIRGPQLVAILLWLLR